MKKLLGPGYPFSQYGGEFYYDHDASAWLI